VASLIGRRFVPVRVHARHDRAAYETLSERFGVEGTPAVLVIDGQGRTRRRVEGFVPPDDFLAHLSSDIAGDPGSG
jgi:thioredoxin-related protein